MGRSKPNRFSISALTSSGIRDPSPASAREPEPAPPSPPIPADFSLRIACSMGPPGTNRVMQNTTMVIPMKVGTSIRNRRAKYAPTGLLAGPLLLRLRPLGGVPGRPEEVLLLLHGELHLRVL